MKNKVLTIVALVIITLIGIVLIFGDQWVEHFAKSKIDKIEGISYDSISIEIESQYIILKNFKIERPAFQAEVENFEVQGISLYELIINNHIKVSEVDLEEVQITYLANNRVSDKKSSSEKKLPKFTITSINVTDGDILIKKNNKTLVRSSFKSNLVDLNSESVKSSSKLLSDIAMIDFKNFEYHTEDSLYVFYSDEIRHAKNEIASITNLEVACNYKKYELGKVVGHEIDWMSVTLDSVIVESSIFHEVILDKKIGVVKVFGLDLSVFRDKRLPFPESQRPRLLKEMLADSSTSFEVDSIIINDANITYQEQVKGEPEPGEIRFENIKGYMSNLSSYNREQEFSPRAVLSTKIMGKNTLYADISFPRSVNGNTIVKGVLNKTDLTVFNPMISNVSDARIKKGILNSLDFEFSYKTDVSNGTMNFTYDDLMIKFIDESGKNKKFPDTNFFNDIKTFIANALVIKKDNERGKKSYSTGKINFERDRQKSMLNFWWKSILTGFKSSIGVTKEKE